MDIGTAIVLSVLIACLMGPIIIESIGESGAFRGEQKQKKEAEKIRESEKER